MRISYSEKDIDQKIDGISGPELRQKNRFVLFLVSLFAALFVGGAVILCATGIGAAVQIIKNAPSIANINIIQPSATKSIMYASDGSIMQELIQSGSNREPVTFDRIPKDLINAVVAIEDTRFYSHDGVDVKGILRALFVDVTSGSLSEGASTITQQLIKNNILGGGMEKNYGDRIERKLQEQYLALKAEKELDKNDIMTAYLNTINLGSNCLGVQVASKRYFGKDVSDLDLAECTVLAAITSNPTVYNPIYHPDKNQKRRLIVLKNMLAAGSISREQYDEASSEDVYKRISSVSNANVEQGQQAFSYFTDAVFTDILGKLQSELKYTDTQAYNLLYSGGLRIYTTMDPDIQKIVDEEVNSEANYVTALDNGTILDYLEYSLSYRLNIRLSNGDEYYYTEADIKKYYQDTLGQTAFKLTFSTEDELKACAASFKEYILKETSGSVISETVIPTIEPQLSVVLMDQATGYVKAICGGRGDKNEIGSLTLNRAIDSERQPGSTFKILTTYAPALDTLGCTLATTYYDAPTTYGEKSISNWWGTYYLGYASIRFAIQASMNVVAVKCLEETVSEDIGYTYAENFGITTLVPQDKSPVLTLGGLTYGTTNLEMTAAYASIANNGVYNEPVFWTKVTDSNGNVILENKQSTRTVLKKETAQLLTSAMETSVTHWFVLWPDYDLSGTSGSCHVPDMAIAGKSGTTTDANDIWFIGYSPYYTMGIWSGYDSSKSFGVSPNYHRVIWQRIMARLSAAQDSAEFDYTGLVKARICSKSGLLARDGICDLCQDSSCHVYEEYFTPDTVPTQYCNRHVFYSICASTGLLSTEYCPEDLVYKKVFLTIDEDDDEGYQTDDTAYTLPAWLSGNYCSAHHPVEAAPAPENSPDGQDPMSSEAPPEETFPALAPDDIP